MSFIEAVVLKGVLMPNMVVPIIGIGACLSINLISFVLSSKEDIRRFLIHCCYVADLCNYFKTASCDLNGDNFVIPEEYLREIVIFYIQ